MKYDTDSIIIGEEMQRVAAEEFGKEIPQEIQASLSMVKAAAQDYLAVLQDIEKEQNYFKQLLLKQKVFRNANRKTYNTVDEYVKTKEEINEILIGQYPKRLYSASFKFQNVLNSFLNQKIKMIYVYQGSQGPELYEINSEEILTFGYSSRNQLVGRYQPTIEQMSTTMKKLEIEEDINKTYLGYLKNAYQIVLHRYKASKNLKPRVVIYKDIYKNNKWTALAVSSEGDINEAYAAFVILNELKKYFSSNNSDVNIYNFLIQGVKNIDNISGLLKGDISKNNIEYGIKSLGASTLGLNQLKILAKKIISDENFNKQKLENIKQQMINRGKQRNKEVKMTEEAIQDILSIIDITQK